MGGKNRKHFHDWPQLYEGSNFYISERCGDTEELKESGLDSLSLVSVIAGIEEQFGFFFEADDLQPDKLLTLKDLVELTEKYI